MIVFITFMGGINIIPLWQKRNTTMLKTLQRTYYQYVIIGKTDL